jgi:hypothetical protein
MHAVSASSLIGIEAQIMPLPDVLPLAERVKHPRRVPARRSHSAL